MLNKEAFRSIARQDKVRQGYQPEGTGKEKGRVKRPQPAAMEAEHVEYEVTWQSINKKYGLI